MRKVYIQVDGVLYEKGKEPTNPLYIIPDIKPYQSMADGSWITSRSKHREHLKVHNCVEIGDQVPMEPVRPQPSSPKDLLIHQFSSMTDADVRKMLRRDVQNAKWNSRKD